jgi:hypothetical protein
VTTARSLNETVEQLQIQLCAAQQQMHAERNQQAFNEAKLSQENIILARQ